MTTEPDPQQMDRDALIAEVVTLRGHRDQLRRALRNIDSIGGAVVDTVGGLDDALDEIEPLMRKTDSLSDRLEVACSVEIAYAQGVVAAAKDVP
ncbi:hypothetical protein SEA_BBQVALINDRA_61 [Gordonia phage BBQValindra]|nr:hypothetical protein SEA_BBQVALINDRA_61 [Gordonia phage BBQValindra]